MESQHPLSNALPSRGYVELLILQRVLKLFTLLRI